jgi:hypothetical protein
MGIGIKDFVSYNAEESWIKHGAEYAQLSWTHTFNRMGSADIFYKMKNIVKGIVAQDGIENKLTKQNIKYKKKERKYWYDTDRYDLEINGIKYDVKANRVAKNFTVPGDLLKYSALVPTDQLKARSLEGQDIYIFAYIDYKEKFLPPFYDPRSSLDKFTNEEHGKWIVHGFWDYDFNRRNLSKLNRVGTVEIKSNDQRDKGITFELGGTTEAKQSYIEHITLNHLNPHGYSITDFYELFYIKLLKNKLPYGTITIATSEGAKEVINPLMGFDSKKVNREIIIKQNDWGDIWLYDAKIYYVGYMTKGDFLKQSEELKRFDKTVYQFEIQTDNNRMYVPDLKPLRDLF